jgi:catechol 2,3-dioxygenase-like lactoylglutathione lyase family enzyme
MRFVRITLHAPADRLSALRDFYGSTLGLATDGGGEGRLSLAVGETELELAPSSGEPFYHFALLVPGNRFHAALDWARARTTLLPYPETGDAVFDFDNWNAQACYFHDPAGNIVELIAHRGVAETSTEGDFQASELVGVSELGLVGDPAALAAPLAERLGLELWDGTIDEPGSLAFVGEKARTLILAPPGRGWLPTGRPAEAHPVEARLSGSPKGEARLDGGRYRISR